MEDFLATRINDFHRIFLFGGFALALVAEAVFPYVAFPDEGSRVRHVIRNMVLGLIGYALVAVSMIAFLLPTLPRSVAAFWSVVLPAPLWLQAVAGLLILDFSNWSFHWLAHRVRWLWLVHAVHHSDPHLDVTTSLRFHPVESVLTLFWQAAFLTLAGLPIWVLFLRLGLASLISLWQHANVAIPPRLDRWLRTVIVSPDMHRLHHSPLVQEANSNYGVIFSFWDRLFGTYCPPHPETDSGYGLKGLTRSEWQTVTGMLLTPVKARQLSIF